MSIVVAVLAVSCQFGSDGNSGTGVNSVGDPSTSAAEGDGTASESATDGSQSGTADGGVTGPPEPTSSTSSTSSTSAAMPDTTSSTDPPAMTSTTEPETGSSSSGDPITPEDACDMFFGGVADYELCDVPNAGQCEFAVTLDGGNCFDLCDSLGSMCVDAFHNSTGGGGDACVPASFTHDCFTDVNDEICVCTLP